MKRNSIFRPFNPWIIGAVATLGAGCCLLNAESRLWTSTDGRTIEAEFIKADDSSATVRKGGRDLTIPLDQLSQSDIEYIEKRRAEVGRFDLTELGEYAKFAKGTWVKGEIADLKFQIHAPDTYEKDHPLPLVMFLHGVGERGEDNERQVNGLPKAFASTENQEARPCIVVAPQCPTDQFWSNAEITERVISLTEDLAEHLPVDQNRIYLSGFSMGGYGTWAVLASDPKLYAAAIPISGGGNPAYARDLKRIPIWNFHGDKDESVSVTQSREMVEALEKVNADITYTEFEGAGHGIADRVVRDPKVQEWLFSQKKDS